MNFSLLISAVEFDKCGWSKGSSESQTSDRQCQVRPERRFDLVYMYSFTTRSQGSSVPRSTFKDIQLHTTRDTAAGAVAFFCCAHHSSIRGCGLTLVKSLDSIHRYRFPSHSREKIIYLLNCIINIIRD